MQPSRGAMSVRSLVVTMGGWHWLCVGRGCVWGFVVVSTPAGAVVDSATIVPSPNAGTSNDRLESVSCVSASDCVAVGYTYTGNANQTLVISLTGPEPAPTTTTTVPASPTTVAPDQVVPVFTG